MPQHPDLDEQDKQLLSGDSGKPPLSALGSFALRCMKRGWGQSEFEAAARGSHILESLCTESNGRQRPQRAESKLDNAWKWAEEKYSPTAEIKHLQSLDNLRREVAKVLTGDDLAVMLGLIAKAERDGHNPVIGPCRAVADLTNLTHVQVNKAMQRLEAAASPDFPIREVTRYKLRSGESKGQSTRLWTLALGWRAEAACVHGGDIPVSPSVRKLTSADRLSYFRACISNLALGEYLTTRELARKVGMSDNQARASLNALFELGEVDRFEGRTRTGTVAYRWGRYPTEAEAADKAAAAAARLEAVLAKQAKQLAEASECRFAECVEIAPPGQRYCREHEALMETLRRDRQDD